MKHHTSSAGVWCATRCLLNNDNTFLTLEKKVVLAGVQGELWDFELTGHGKTLPADSKGQTRNWLTRSATSLRR